LGDYRHYYKGTSVVYVSESLALSALEKFVHTPNPAALKNLVYFKAEIPKSLAMEMLDIKDLPTDWNEQPPADSTKILGTEWVKAAKTAVLKVPYVVVPESWNFLLNPTHSDFKKIIIHPHIPYTYDS
jgi:RES domain-containing protein